MRCIVSGKGFKRALREASICFLCTAGPERAEKVICEGCAGPAFQGNIPQPPGFCLTSATVRYNKRIMARLADSSTPADEFLFQPTLAARQTVTARKACSARRAR